MRSSKAARLGLARCSRGWAPRRDSARNGPSRWAPNSWQRPAQCCVLASRKTAIAPRSGSIPQVTKVGAMASTPSLQSQSSSSNNRGRSVGTSSGKASPSPPLICKSMPRGLIQSPFQLSASGFRWPWLFELSSLPIGPNPVILPSVLRSNQC